MSQSKKASHAEAITETILAVIVGAFWVVVVLGLVPYVIQHPSLANIEPAQLGTWTALIGAFLQYIKAYIVRRLFNKTTSKCSSCEARPSHSHSHSTKPNSNPPPQEAKRPAPPPRNPVGYRPRESAPRTPFIGDIDDIAE